MKYGYPCLVDQLRQGIRKSKRLLNPKPISKNRGQKMKKTIAILLIIAISLLFVVACSSPDTTVDKEDQINPEIQEESVPEEVPQPPGLPADL